MTSASTPTTVDHGGRASVFDDLASREYPTLPIHDDHLTELQQLVARLVDH